jgi:hypothetical protein
MIAVVVRERITMKQALHMRKYDKERIDATIA